MDLVLKRLWSDKPPTFFLISIIFVICVIDVLALRILSLLGPDYSVTISVFVFAAFFTSFLIIEIMFIKLLSSFKSIQRYNSKKFGILYGILLLSPIAPNTLIVLILFQIIELEEYNIVLIPFATITSFIPGILILSLLVSKFVSWFSHQHDYIMLSYVIAITATVFNAIIFILNLPAAQFNYDSVRVSITVQDLINNIGVPERYFQDVYIYSSFLSFLLIWIATSILLRNYSRKVGKWIYWSLVSLPLIYFLLQTPHVFDQVFSTVRDNDPSLYVRLVSIVFGLNKTVGGLFFAIGFWVIARSINNRQIRNYLTISGHGILLLFVATQANSLIISPYPPFGIIAISSMALASLLTFIGLYFTALSVSRETQVRVEIDRKVKQLTFIKKMGMAQMEVELYKQVLPMVDKTSNLDYVPTSIDPDDIKLLVKEAIEAVKEKKSLT